MNEVPYTILSCAITLDGYLDDAGEHPLHLSGPADVDRVDGIRAESDAILVGAATVRNDDPRLLVRARERIDGRRRRGATDSPKKVTVSGHVKLDPASAFFTTGDVEKLVYCPSLRVDEGRQAFGDLATVVDGGEPVTMRHVAEDLYERGVRRLMVEGGATVHTQFLTEGIADELQLVVAPFFLGDPRARRWVDEGDYPWGNEHRARLVETRTLDDVVLVRYALSERGEAA
ncbi:MULTISPECIES: RibD family protein [Mumia]|uniref:RibD family protein n=1 Tax=Mumia TaxID=1546255 RepID=UPI00141EF324|nr:MULTISPECIES: RibD family protein [unclassified Mumia]QMW67906.1 RibD family protein [Mumia sp. ZJ1417]